MVRANFKPNKLFESVDNLFERGYEPSIAINKPFDKYYKVATIKDLQDLGTDINSDSDLASFIADDPCNECYTIVGYAISKPRYQKDLEKDGMSVMSITDQGNLCYNVGSSIYDADIDEIRNTVGEDLNESDSSKFDVGEDIGSIIDDILAKLGDSYSYTEDGTFDNYTNTFYKDGNIVAEIKDDELIDLDRDEVYDYILGKIKDGENKGQHNNHTSKELNISKQERIKLLSDIIKDCNKIENWEQLDQILYRTDRPNLYDLDRKLASKYSDSYYNAVLDNSSDEYGKKPSDVGKELAKDIESMIKEV